MYWYVYISLSVLAGICVASYLNLRIKPDQAAQNPVFLSFQRRFVPLYLLAVLGDWLQGPYLYRLYHYYGFVEHQVAVIYISGLISSVVFFPAKDYIVDNFGRKKSLVVFAMLYGLSCAFILSRNYVVLMVGRFIAGLANSLLFSTLEAWYVHEHVNTYDFPKEWIQVTFSHIAFGSSITAVVAGLVADFCTRVLNLGPSAPFVLAMVVLWVFAGLAVYLLTENRGEQKAVMGMEEVKKSCLEGLKAITLNPDIFLIGTVQSVFESCVFMFVFVWTPAVGGEVVRTGFFSGIKLSDIPLGVAFASFMLCHLLGGIICDHLIHRSHFPTPRLLLPVTGLASLLFVLSALFSWRSSDGFWRAMVFFCLQLFELACGFYFPVMRVLRGKVLPKDHQLRILSLFRIPLTILSALALIYLHDVTGGIPEIFAFCATLMGVAFVCSLRFVRTTVSSSLLEQPLASSTET